MAEFDNKGSSVRRPLGYNGSYNAAEDSFMTSPAHTRFNLPSVPIPPTATAVYNSRVRASSTTPNSKKPNIESLCSESFTDLSQDISRLTSTWLTRVDGELKRRVAEFQADMARFEEEKAQAWARRSLDREREYERLHEERRRVEGEQAAAIKQIGVEREEGRRKLQEDREGMEDELRNAKDEVAQRREKLSLDIAAYEDEKLKVLDANLAAQTMVDINVGGITFESSRRTLTQQKESLLDSLFSGRHNLARDRNGRIFLDRDPELFRQILNFLRDPESPPYPSDEMKSSALINEAAYYGIKFHPFPLVFAVGGHNNSEYLSSIEVLDVSQQCWKTLSSMDTERSFHGAAVQGGKLLVFGGQNFEYKALCHAEIYDMLRDEWLSAPPLHTPRRNLASCSAHGRVYAIGGFDAQNILSSVEAYDPRTRQWSSVCKMREGRSGSSSAVVVNSQSGFEDIYVVGGTKGERLRTVDRYSVRMNCWETLPHLDMLDVRSSVSAVALYGSLFAIGGVDTEHRIHKSLEAVDLTSPTQEWRYLPSMTSCRSDCSSVSVSESILVTGGQDQGSALSTIEFYRPDVQSWQAGPDLNEARYGHTCIVANI